MKLLLVLPCLFLSILLVAPQRGAAFELKKNEHISIIGNTLADRMQHDNWLETLIYAKFPDKNLVFRNLAFAGDEVVFRHRSENFGTPDEWLTKTKADVIFAFFGFNESFKGAAGLEGFKKDLGKFLTETKTKNYSGNGSPRLVLFSPIANEKLRDPNYPDPKANNENIANYTAAMAEVAKAEGVLLVNLFTISQELYAQAAKKGESLTMNSLHLTEAGNQALATEIFRTLFNEKPPTKNLEKLRSAISEKMSWGS